MVYYALDETELFIEIWTRSLILSCDDTRLLILSCDDTCVYKGLLEVPTKSVP